MFVESQLWQCWSSLQSWWKFQDLGQISRGAGSLAVRPITVHTAVQSVVVDVCMYVALYIHTGG